MTTRLFAFTLLPVAAFAQQVQAPFITAAEVAARIAKADAAVKAGSPAAPAPLLLLDSYRANMQYLVKPMPAYAVHEDEEELFVVLDGSGTMNLGATLVNPRRGTGATTLIAEKATGGTDHKLTKGDMFIVPMNTARCVTQVDGKLVMMSIRLPHTAAAAAPGR